MVVRRITLGHAKGSATLNFRRRDSRIFRFLAWFLDSWINFLWFLFTKYGFGDRVIYNIRRNAKYTKRKVEISVLDSRISYWFPDSSSDSKWFLEPSMWFGIVADPSGHAEANILAVVLWIHTSEQFYRLKWRKSKVRKGVVTVFYYNHDNTMTGNGKYIHHVYNRSNKVAN